MTAKDRGRGAGVPPRQRLSPIARELTSENVKPGEYEFHPRSIAGDPFTSADPIKQYEKGRICASPGCDNRLSIYNPTDFCAQHPGTKMLLIDSELPKIARIDSKKVRKTKRHKAEKKKR